MFLCAFHVLIPYLSDEPGVPKSLPLYPRLFPLSRTTHTCFFTSCSILDLYILFLFFYHNYFGLWNTPAGNMVLSFFFFVS